MTTPAKPNTPSAIGIIGLGLMGSALAWSMTIILPH